MADGCLTCCNRSRSRSSSRGTNEQTALLGSHEAHGNHGNHHADLPRKDYESLDYDRCFNKPYEDYLETQRRNHSLSKIEVIKWVITFFIGLSTGLVAFFIDTFVKLLSKLKFNTVDDSITSCSKDGCLAVSLIILMLFNAGFVFIAATLTVLEPVAAGSGIPEIKCYLNGVKIPRVARLKSLLAKAVGVLFSVAGGLFVGKEGPMIHSGAIVGAGIPQFQSITVKKLHSKYDFFRTDRDKRDFVSGGAAAGVAAAFGAPIGGVLFSLEEGSSFWNQKLTWRTLFCSMSATFTLNFFLSGMEGYGWGAFYAPGLINFGTFKCPPENTSCRLWTAIDLFIFILMGIIGSLFGALFNQTHIKCPPEDTSCRLWTAMDLFIFILMGIIGGLFGALFNQLNTYLTVYRMKHVQNKRKVVKIAEAILVAMATTTVAFVASMLLGNCLPNDALNVTSVLNDDVRDYFCPDGYYNDMATLFFNSQEEAIKQLFHQHGDTDRFTLRSLGLFFIFFFLLACWTYGAGVPSGLFVPCLLCGAAYGRFVSTLLTTVIGFDHGIYSGSFALIGAAAFLGGVVRMTISLTVILVESTNEISYGLPLMLVLMVAKWSGDFFNEGLYDIHIHLKGVPLLEWDPPSTITRLTAKNIMSESLHFIFPRTRVAIIQRILKTTAHNVFPVVSIVDRSQLGDLSIQDQTEDKLGLDPTQLESTRLRYTLLKFEGMILRSQLVVLIQNGIFYPDDDQSTSQPEASYDALTSDYPRYPDIADITNNQIYEAKYILDVRQYMNSTPYTVYPDTPVNQVFYLFRSMGLRHLPVVDHYGQIQGLVTRHNLTHEYLEARQAEMNDMQDLNLTNFR